MRDHPRILIANDMTARGDRPFDRATRLARGRQGSVILLHVVDVSDRRMPSLPLDKAREDIIAQLPRAEVPLEVIVKTGSPPAIIAETAADIDADLVLVGAARFNDLADHFLGTAVDYLVRRTTIPVLVVKRRPLSDFRNVMIATDFSRCSTHAAMAAATMVPHVHLAILHAFSIPFQTRLDHSEMLPFAQNRAQEEMNDFLALDELAPIRERLAPQIEEGPALSVVDRYIRDKGTDLVALGTHGRSGFMHALIGSRASQILAATSCDVLTVRETDGK